MPPVKRITAIFLIVSLLFSLCTVLTVFATDSAPLARFSRYTEKEYVTASPSAANDTVNKASASQVQLLTAASPSNPGSDTVMTGDELLDWMDRHASSGGTVTLAADLTINGTIEWAQPYRARPMVIDLAAHSITVTGEFALLGASLTIRADGSENSRVIVAEGGWLSLDAILEGGVEPVVWQNEGSVLYTQYMVTQREYIHYARMPVADCTYERPMLAIVEAGDSAAESLPDSIEAKVCRDGVASWEECAITWQLDDKETADMLNERIRTSVQGIFSDMDAVGSRLCDVVFHDQAITFLQVQTSENSIMRKILMDFTVPVEDAAVMVQYSFDGEIWNSYDPGRDIPGVAALSLFLPEYAADDDPVWDVTDNPQIYVRIFWPDAGQAADVYSDIIVILSENMKVYGDIGGNRGGGTELPGLPQLPSESPGPSEQPSSEQPSPEQPSSEQPSSEQPSSEQPTPEESTSGKPTGSQQTSGRTSGSNKHTEQLPETQPALELSSDPDQTQVSQGHSAELSEPHLPLNQEDTSIESERPADTSPELLRPAADTTEPLALSQPETDVGPLESTLASAADIDQHPAGVVSALPQSEAAERSLLDRAIPLIAGSSATALLISMAGIYHSVYLREQLLKVIKYLFRMKK